MPIRLCLLLIATTTMGLACSGSSTVTTTPPPTTTTNSPVFSGFKFATSSTYAVFSGNSGTVTVPVGTDKSALVAMFRHNASSIKVGSTAQQTGVTPNNFNAPVTYTLTLSSGETADYTIQVVESSYDLFGPVITSFSASPATATTFPATITLQANYTEVGSAFSSVSLYLCSPTYLATGRGQRLLASGTNMGTYVQGTVTLQSYHESGAWKICDISIRDTASNHSTYFYNNTVTTQNFSYFTGTGTPLDTGLAFPGTVTVTSASSDTTAPVFTSLNNISVSSVSTFPASVNVSLNFSETGGSGLAGGTVTLCGPNSLANGFYKGSRVTGNLNSLGQTSSAITIENYHETGLWKICAIDLRDTAGNTNGYILNQSISSANYAIVNGISGTQNTYTNSGIALAGSLTVNSTAGDTAIPTVTSVSVTSASSVSTYPATVNFSVTYSDTGSGGAANGIITFCSPRNQIAKGGTSIAAALTKANATTYTGSATLQSYHETGTWNVCQLGLTDLAANPVSLATNPVSPSANYYLINSFPSFEYGDYGLVIGGTVTKN